jgi:hypothetical protein
MIHNRSHNRTYNNKQTKNTKNKNEQAMKKNHTHNKKTNKYVFQASYLGQKGHGKALHKDGRKEEGEFVGFLGHGRGRGHQRIHVDRVGGALLVQFVFHLQRDKRKTFQGK